MQKVRENGEEPLTYGLFRTFLAKPKPNDHWALIPCSTRFGVEIQRLLLTTDCIGGYSSSTHFGVVVCFVFAKHFLCATRGEFLFVKNIPNGMFFECMHFISRNFVASAPIPICRYFTNGKEVLPINVLIYVIH